MNPILITGVGQRVGLHLARIFVGRGQPVIGTYRSARRSIEELEQLGVELHRCDFNEDSQVQALIDDIAAKHTGLRAIIHNASDWLPDMADYPPEEILHRMMAVHVELVDLAAEVLGLAGGEDGLVGAAHRSVLAQRCLLLG